MTKQEAENFQKDGTRFLFTTNNDRTVREATVAEFTEKHVNLTGSGWFELRNVNWLETLKPILPQPEVKLAEAVTGEGTSNIATLPDAKAAPVPSGT